MILYYGNSGAAVEIGVNSGNRRTVVGGCFLYSI
jgi:hypothetical protein